MRGIPGTLAAIAATALIVWAGVAHAEEGPTRAEYVSVVEPICESNTKANQQILKGAREKVRSDKLPAAGRQFVRASHAFGRAVDRIIAVPRPSADVERLDSWFGFLRKVTTNLRNFGVALKADNLVKANHQRIRTERSANAANNVGSIFPFRYCKLSASRFSGT